ncbi:hypothetical protein I3F58_20890 [Streptomyces sp. MUM 203J]|uniref:hypothetical protein n=1 Tax=Streptomyces sp. MUM 203J TaxID=2791990 RepID=UPI001F03BFBC|nr:hypothetical protein [Streptomyces sp. MUM 203J]MCH0541978.1 hypothetical protein [Streptomyces sp. MUM 203J]
MPIRRCFPCPRHAKGGRGRTVRNASLCRDNQGTRVFVARTFYRPLALDDPEDADTYLRRATRNLVTRLRVTTGSRIPPVRHGYRTFTG